MIRKTCLFCLCFIFIIHTGVLFGSTDAEDKEQLDFYYAKLKADVSIDNTLHVMTYLARLRQLSISQNAKEIEIESYFLEAMIKRRYGAYGDGVKLNHYALKLAKSAGNEEYTAWAYLHLAHLELELERFTLALDYIQYPIDFYKNNNANYAALMFLWQSKIYLRMGSYYQALQANSEALKVVTSSMNIYSELAINQAEILLKLGNIEAAKLALSLVDLKKLGGSKARIKLHYYLALANSHLQTGGLNQAIEIALAQLENPINLRFLEEQARLQYLIAIAYRQQSDYKLAYKYLKRYALSKDALSLQRRNNKVLQLESHYKFDLQNQELKLLGKDNILKEQRLDQQQQAFTNHRLQQQRWVLGAVLLFSIVGFVYWRWQNQRYLVVLKQRVAERTQELAKSNERLKAMSFTDSLTDLHNRHYFFSVINELLVDFNSLPDNTELQRLVFALIDIDKFKNINDSFGHSVGDQVLEQFSHLLKQQVRSDDLLIRWGGEEFLLVMKNTSYDEAAHTVEKIRAEIADHLFTLNNGESLHATCSIGFASYPLLDTKPQLFSWEQIIELADGGLYLAKENQRNAWVGIKASDSTSHQQSEDVVKNYRVYLEQRTLHVTTNIERTLKY
ncbi:GGDEF domain-containing protein [Pseudoalteromonas sp. NEC-BIFX-2020_002]|uniref:tetratricopeptide repeat-containing diguanylate cyclase n=1 Tax=Pseudoalteromonas sp. NEC-BIFX-2020_002 TaxID=2732353 RepID=UPI0014777228|nr:GGDEF domain-containing protein [Pseudoalteromonas sp. NEC-BIFX-2020_002]NNG41928.1 GGDEF domain-containing protein [Pseudoalteromonas sp. NEC-BIFX-2020_002]